jgi:hypothetical protein
VELLAVSELMLVKQASLDGFTEAEKVAVRKFLFQVMDGHGKEGQKMWRRWWKSIINAEIGEMFRWAMKRDRSGPYHRRTMKIIGDIFDAQERFDNEDQFLNWVKIGAGHVVWAAGPRGGVVPLPKSISYSAADQDEFMRFHEGAMQFFRGEHAPRYLWNHMKPAQAAEMMNTILAGFDE